MKEESHNCYENVAACWEGGHKVEIFCTECENTGGSRFIIFRSKIENV